VFRTRTNIRNVVACLSLNLSCSTRSRIPFDAKRAIDGVRLKIYHQYLVVMQNVRKRRGTRNQHKSRHLVDSIVWLLRMCSIISIRPRIEKASSTVGEI
jgi:hypothetical protein